MYNNVIDFIRQTFQQPEGVVPLHAPCFIGNEKKYLNECIDSTFVSSVGKFVDRFEEMVAEYTGAKKAVCEWSECFAFGNAFKRSGAER